MILYQYFFGWRETERAWQLSCGRKLRFETKLEAMKENKGQRAYPCSFCDGWHLTKKARLAK